MSSTLLLHQVMLGVAMLFAGAVQGLRTSTDMSTVDVADNLLLLQHQQRSSLHNHWNFLHPESGVKVADESNKGGGGCAACTLVIGLLEQVAQIKNQTVDKTIGNFCGHVDPKITKSCKKFFDEFGPAIIKMIENEFTGDEVCNGLNICKDIDGEKKCRLFPPSHLGLKISKMARAVQIKKVTEEVRHSLITSEGGIDPKTNLRAFNVCTIVPAICAIADHLPAKDDDGDRFSPKGAKTLRGTYWRGTDCNDSDASVHPGAAGDSSSGVDQNCNGISGVDIVDGATYEDKYCNNTGSQGVAILGDSATAHFAIPPQWLTAKDVAASDFKVFDNLGLIAEDEMDWPMLSWSTGHLNTSVFREQSGPVDSLYLQAKENNLCNADDYQNLGVNGARVNHLKPFAKLLGRTSAANPTDNKPLQLWMAMIGNDVCNGHHTFETMTPVDEYKASVKEAVLYADTVLAPGSSIVLVGLVDGRVLWNAMWDRIHPIGSTNQDVTYEDVYDYLNCLHVNPCWGWLNSNATIRNLTSTHAAALSATLPEVVTETQPVLKNIKVVSILDWIVAIEDAPYPTWQLIEPVDGFHPSQIANALIAQYMNNQTQQLGVAPAVNPNNAAIKLRFGL